MILLESFLVALSTYSVLPVPQFEWNTDNMKYAICFFPAVGVLCGAAIWGWMMLANALEVSSFFFAVIAACIPLLITGGIHMDGYMDTVDALASHQSMERKLQILKDPNCGAFAVIYCGIYLLVYAGLMHELWEAGCVSVICPVFVLSRALSALCAVSMPNARRAGMLHAYTKNTEKRIAAGTLLLTAGVSAAFLLFLSPVAGGVTTLFALGALCLYRNMAWKQFGGVTGDTSGFFLQICELSGLLGAWIGSLVI